jgi:hypothetical protein
MTMSRYKNLYLESHLHFVVFVNLYAIKLIVIA